MRDVLSATSSLALAASLAVSPWAWLLIDRPLSPLIGIAVLHVIAVLISGLWWAWINAWPSDWHYYVHERRTPRWLGRSERSLFAPGSASDIVLWFGARIAVGWAVSLSAYIAGFSTLYFWLSHDAHGLLGTDSRPSIVECVYFTVVTLATVGYGDLYATTDSARVAVIVQITSGFLLVAVFIGLVIGGLTWMVAFTTSGPERRFKGG